MAAEAAGVTKTEIQNADPDAIQQTKANTTPILVPGQPPGAPPATSTGGSSGAAGSGAAPAQSTGGSTTKVGGTQGTTSGTGTTATGATTTTSGGTEQPPAWKEYFDKATQTEFSYNPAEDNEYRLAASQVEQQVTDMMVGRGGLYSSVASSALTSKLMELQVSYQKMAYENFKEERNYNMQLASFVADREDKEWEKSFKMSQFQAELDQQKFDNQIKTAQLRIQQANAAYNKQIAAAKVKQANAENQLMMMQGDYAQRKIEYDAMVTKWKQDGQADAEVAAYFGSNALYLPFDSSASQSLISRARSQMESGANQIIDFSRSTNDGKLYLETLDDFVASNSGASYDEEYASAYNIILSEHQSGMSWSQIMQQVNSMGGELAQTVGPTNYTMLLGYLDDKVVAEEKTSSGDLSALLEDK
jgi:hypothetical protein